MSPHTWVRPAGDDGPTEDPAITAANTVLAAEDAYPELLADAKVAAQAFLEAMEP